MQTFDENEWQISEDLCPITILEELLPEPFNVYCNQRRYTVKVDVEIPEVSTFHLVIPNEDYHYALTEYVRLNDNANDFYIDVLIIKYEPSTLTHTIQPWRLAVIFDKDTTLSFSKDTSVHVMPFSQFIAMIGNETDYLD